MANIPYLLNSMSITGFLVLTGVAVAALSGGFTALGFFFFRRRYWVKHIGSQARLEIRHLKRTLQDAENEVHDLRAMNLRMRGAQKAAIAVLHDSSYVPAEEKDGQSDS